jgi:ABC-2 type transport system ATP-binding protein
MARIWQGTLTSPLPVDETLAAVDLADKLEVETANLSGGERRRLDIALSVLGNPELLVLDEPTTGLDPESRRHIWSLIRGLVRRGATVLLTTHYLEEAENLADRIAIMHDGLIVREGTLADIVAEAPSRISFVRPADLALADLDLPETTVTLTDRMLIETRTLQDTLARVLAWAGTTPLPQLEARSASLEQVFLSIADTEELR